MTVLLFVAAYVIGSIPSAVLVGRLFYGVDIRNHGSNNPGATNTVRVLGKRAGVLVLIGDIGKGALGCGPPLYPASGCGPTSLRIGRCLGALFPAFRQFPRRKSNRDDSRGTAHCQPLDAARCLRNFLCRYFCDKIRLHGIHFRRSRPICLFLIGARAKL